MRFQATTCENSTPEMQHVKNWNGTRHNLKRGTSEIEMRHGAFQKLKGGFLYHALTHWLERLATPPHRKPSLLMTSTQTLHTSTKLNDCITRRLECSKAFVRFNQIRLVRTKQVVLDLPQPVIRPRGWEKGHFRKVLCQTSEPTSSREHSLHHHLQSSCRALSSSRSRWRKCPPPSQLQKMCQKGLHWFHSPSSWNSLSLDLLPKTSVSP